MNIDYKFKNLNLLELALSHPSTVISNGGVSYERMEFLGDRVLNLIIAEHLYKTFPELPEGKLALILSSLVSRPTLASVAMTIDLGKNLKMSGSEDTIGGRDNSKNLGDALEALIGAVFIDGGFSEAKNFILSLWHEYLSHKHTDLIKKDPKSTLQEWAQKNGKAIPIYQVIERVGADHNPTFTIGVKVEGFESLEAQGKTKKEAEAKAAEFFCQLYNIY